jgi:hypothetical protein
MLEVNPPGALEPRAPELAAPGTEAEAIDEGPPEMLATGLVTTPDVPALGMAAPVAEVPERPGAVALRAPETLGVAVPEMTAPGMETVGVAAPVVEGTPELTAPEETAPGTETPGVAVPGTTEPGMDASGVDALGEDGAPTAEHRRRS